MLCDKDHPGKCCPSRFAVLVLAAVSSPPHPRSIAHVSPPANFRLHTADHSV